jgi:hypothetical protein
MKIPDNKTWFKILLIIAAVQIVAYFFGWVTFNFLK